MRSRAAFAVWTLLLVVLSSIAVEACRPNKKYAYVTIHYEGTPRDEEYVLGIRVMVQSIKATGTQHDVIVLVSKNVRESSRQAFRDLGCIVTEVADVVNPYKKDDGRRLSYQPRFEYALNKLHLWNMTQYERLIYLDADNILLRNMDELFGAGHFCVVFMNMCTFHTGLMVIKPNATQYQMLLESLYTLHSDDGADQGFLSSYFSDMEYQPLFDVTKGCSEHTRERLFSGYNLNHMYFYENWHLNRYRKYHFANYTIPALSLAYPIAPLWKPWYWYAYIGLKMHWEFDAVRTTLGDNHDVELIIRLLILFVFYMGLNPLIARRKLFPNHVTKASHVIQACCKFLGKRMVAIVAALVSTFISVLLGLMLVPGMMAPRSAWPLFLISQDVFYTTFLGLFALFCVYQPISSTKVFTYSVVVDFALAGILGADIYSSPVQKVLVAFVFMNIYVMFKIYWFHHVLRSCMKLRKGDRPDSSLA
jgi:hypothetical protein